MSNHSVLLKILVDDRLAYEVENPATKPAAGEFIDIPSQNGKKGTTEVYVGKVINKYPDTRDMDSPTIIECQCATV